MFLEVAAFLFRSEVLLLLLFVLSDVFEFFLEVQAEVLNKEVLLMRFK